LTNALTALLAGATKAASTAKTNTAATAAPAATPTATASATPTVTNKEYTNAYGKSVGDTYTNALGQTFKITGINSAGGADVQVVNGNGLQASTAPQSLPTTPAQSSVPSTPTAASATPAAASSSGYVAQGTFNDEYLKQLAAQGNQAAVSALNQINTYKQQYAAAQAAGDTAGMQAANNAANAIRGQYGYNGGGDGSLGQFPMSASASGDLASQFQLPNQTGNISTNQSVLNQYAQEPYTYDPYYNRYDAIINQQAGEVINRDPFSYDYNTDPSYQAFLKSYLREGDIASNNALAQSAARTGGMPSSYSLAVANQARDYYAAQAADRIPELYNAAYQRYLNEYDMNVQDVNLMSGLEANDYNQYTNGRNFDYGIYADRQGWAGDALNASLGIESTQYDRAAADRAYQQQIQAAAQAQGNYQGEFAYQQQQDAYNQAMSRTQLFGYVTAADAALLGVPAGTPIASLLGSTSSSGGGSGGGGLIDDDRNPPPPPETEKGTIKTDDVRFIPLSATDWSVMSTDPNYIGNMDIDEGSAREVAAKLGYSTVSHMFLQKWLDEGVINATLDPETAKAIFKLVK
jgi:hypothetical protein